MELYVGINRATMDIILISDKKELVEEKIKNSPIKDSCSNIQICSTGNISFSSGFTADISYTYELQCLEESVLTRMLELGIDTDSPESKRLSERLAVDAYYDMIHYDVSEDYAISEAFKLHSMDLDTLKQSTEEQNETEEDS